MDASHRRGEGHTTLRAKAHSKQPPAERTVIVREAYITLGQLLKGEDVVDSGGAAKAYLAETSVQVNGEPESRRGRKLRPGDVVRVPEGPTLRLIASPDAAAISSTEDPSESPEQAS
jgi:ribosome-associated protein